MWPIFQILNVSSYSKQRGKLLKFVKYSVWLHVLNFATYFRIFLVMVMLVTLQYSVNLFRIMIVRNNSFESVHIFVYQHSLIGVNLQFATTTFNINQLLQLIAFYREKNERCNRSWMRKRSRLSSYRKHIPHYNRKWKWKQRS